MLNAFFLGLSADVFSDYVEWATSTGVGQSARIHLQFYGNMYMSSLNEYLLEGPLESPSALHDV